MFPRGCFQKCQVGDGFPTIFFLTASVFGEFGTVYGVFWHRHVVVFLFGTCNVESYSHPMMRVRYLEQMQKKHHKLIMSTAVKSRQRPHDKVFTTISVDERSSKVDA